jgi:magnesium transporter
VGVLNGLLLAVASAALTYVLIDAGVFNSSSEPLNMGLVIGLASLANLVIATLSGAAIPLVLRRLGLDPALASSILLTLITDVVGFGGFLLVAAALLG